MAKKKSTKATAKKKAAAKSTEEKKNTTAKKSTAKKNSAKKASSAKTSSSSNTSKKSQTSETKKAESIKKTKVTLKELLSRKFEKPENIVVEPEPKRMTYDAIPDAPPVFETKDSNELKRIKGLLMQKIDITDIPPPKPEPKKIVPIGELIMQKYAVSPKSLWVPPEKDRHLPDPPPYIDASDPKKQSKIRDLLFQNISLKDVQPLKETPKKEKSAPAPAKAKIDKPSVPVSELLRNTYPAWTPQSVMPAPEKTKHSMPDSPPFIEGSDDEIRRIRELLFKKIDITDVSEMVQEQTTPEKTQAEAPDIVQKEKTDSIKADEPDSVKADEPTIENTQNIEKQIFQEKPDQSEPPDNKETLDTLIQPEPDYSDYTLETNKEAQLMSNSLKCVFAGILVLFVMLYMASSSNHSKFYLVDGKAGAEVWQGNFSPMGKSYMLTLMGMELPETEQNFYSQSEIYPLICGFYLDQANVVLSEDNIPNLFQVKEYLEMAYNYATEDIQEKIQKRLNGIDFMMFILRADMEIQKGTENDLEKAREYIEEAEALAEKNYQKDMIKNRLQLINEKKTEDQSSEPATETETETESQSKANDTSKKSPQDQDKSESH